MVIGCSPGVVINNDMLMSTKELMNANAAPAIMPVFDYREYHFQQHAPGLARQGSPRRVPDSVAWFED